MAEELTAQQAFDQFWPKAMEEIKASQNTAMKHQELPLARIKKVLLHFWLTVNAVGVQDDFQVRQTCSNYS